MSERGAFEDDAGRQALRDEPVEVKRRVDADGGECRAGFVGAELGAF